MCRNSCVFGVIACVVLGAGMAGCWVGSPVVKELYSERESADILVHLLNLNRAVVKEVQIEPGARAKLVAIVAGRPVTESGGHLTLEVRCGRLEGGKAPGIRVFLNKLDATRSTPVEDPHYVGSFTFFPNSAARDSEHGQAFLLDAAKVIGRLASLKELKVESPLIATLVAIKIREDESVSATVPIQNVILSTTSQER